MKSRVLWFVAGTTAGVYGTFKARRVAYRLTPDGLADQVAAWQLGARAFAEEMRTGMARREQQISEQLGLPAPAPPAPVPPASAPPAPAPDALPPPAAALRPLTPYDE